MIQSEDYIYSKSAVARMLNIAQAAVVRVEKWATCAFVIIKNKRPRFWKKLDFLCHFADWRRKQSEGLKAEHKYDNCFSVNSSKPGKNYTCKLSDNAIACDCEDYKNQGKFLGKPGICKHGYAVLKQLGVNLLSDYIKDKVFDKFKDNLVRAKAHKLTVARTDAYSFCVQDGPIYYHYSEAKPHTIECHCSEYPVLTGKNLCKHGYAVLNHLGFKGNQALSDYILGYEWVINDYLDEEHEAEVAKKHFLETEHLEEEERDARNCLFTAQSWSF